MRARATPPALFSREASNPILSAADWPYPVHAVFNAGATTLKDGTTLLLCRVEDHRGISHLSAARSANGVDGFEIDPEPTLAPDPERFPEERFGIEDPRITYLPELDRYAVVYTAFTRDGPGVALALTEDFRTFERRGLIFPPDDKDAALLPRRIDGRFAMIHRPVTQSGAHVWVSYSSDLRHFGGSELVLSARRGAFWDSSKIGLSAPLLETERGWLMLYHGVRVTASGSLYRMGAALLEREHPERCLLRGEPWLFGPDAPYERVGDVPNVVFPCGYTLGADLDTLNLYYGAADTVMALARASVRELIAWLEQHGKPESP
jgi:predicted GH43/DUF377 family glycosyl hydrolase